MHPRINYYKVAYQLFVLGMRRFQSKEAYRAMQSYIAELAVNELQARGIDFSRSKVLELAAGPGGYSAVLNRMSGSFMACDLHRDKIFDTLNIPFCEVDVMRPFPFQSNSFDLVYCSSLIEHLADPANMLEEARRVLTPSGFLYLSFPPFYSLAMIGGHQFKPYHFLGEKFAVALTNRLRGSKIKNYATCFGDYGLHPLRIDQVKDLVLRYDFKLIDIYTRLSPVNTARLPGVLKDLLTWHVCYLFQKSS